MYFSKRRRRTATIVAGVVSELSKDGETRGETSFARRFSSCPRFRNGCNLSAAVEKFAFINY